MSGLYGCNEVVTVWNRFKNPESGRDEFVRHVLPVLCGWKLSVKRGEYGSEANMAVSAGISQNLIVLVPFSDKYRHYDVWKEMDADARKRFFTLHVSDLIAKGSHNVEITGETPYTETEVKKRFGESAATIAAVSDYTGGAVPREGAHLRVGCFYGVSGWRR